MSNQDFLVEIGTEELPPKALRTLSDAFRSAIETGLNDHQLDFSSCVAFASPRRLAVLVSDLQTEAAEQTIEVWGPPQRIAFDAEGKPTKAALAFARKNGLDPEQLITAESPKGPRLIHRKTLSGARAEAVIPSLVGAALEQLPIPKRMHWGALKELFVRPVHWIVLLFGDRVIPATIMGIESGAKTRGHRFHHPGELVINAPADYQSLLERQGKVIADINQRRTMISHQVNAQAQAIGAQAVIEDELLDEVTALVEWPVALTGNFDERFLDVPQEALVSSMTEHQKYFPVVDAQGKLLPHFIFAANIESKDPAQVIAGNEKVIRPRLADAAFFYETDKQQSLESRLPRLEAIVFQEKLGTVRDKANRIAKLARIIAHQLSASSELAERAGLLAKADLVSEMVLEFSDLQGIAGSCYARNDNEPGEVTAAIREHYLPRFAGDDLPGSTIGSALALADRLDTLVGIFGINQPPTGSKDPFALRRAVLGIIRIIRERQYVSLDLNELIFEAKTGYGDRLLNADVEHDVSAFIFDRYRAIYHDEGIATDTVIAVQNVLQKLPTPPHNPYDVALRISAVESFRSLPEAQALAAANKRVKNILAKQQGENNASPVVLSLLATKQEIDLHRGVVELAVTVPRLCEQRDYRSALQQLASLKNPIDAFFDHVMVMDENLQLRTNRVNLLRELYHLFLQIADIAQLDIG